MENECRVLLVTFPAQGHINPALQFAKRLLQTGTKVTFLTADYAIGRMISTTPTSQGLCFLGFPDGLEEGLKLGKSPDENMAELKKRGSEAVKEIIMSSVEKCEPFSHVVYTTLLPWVGQVAHALEVPSTILWIQPATLFDIYYHYCNGYDEAIQNHGNDPSWFVELPGLPRLTIEDLPSFFIDLSKFEFVLPSFNEQMKVLKAQNNPKVLVNSFNELEFEALRVAKDLNLVPIGPLIPSAFLDRNSSSNDSFSGDMFKKSDDYMEWLNSRENGSVIYVAFGSYMELPKQQMEEIAKGLIQSGRPCLWVIRKGKNGDKKNNEEIIMDFTLLQELEKQGKIVEWCTQVEVLSHPSVGCFVTHCGWNSSLESIACGVPLICYPQWTDQNTNAKLIEDVWEMGIRVIKNDEGIVDGNEIKRCVEIVIGGSNRGEKMKRNAKKWKDLAREAVNEGGSSYLNLKNFVDQEIRGVGVVQD